MYDSASGDLLLTLTNSRHLIVTFNQFVEVSRDCRAACGDDRQSCRYAYLYSQLSLTLFLLWSPYGIRQTIIFCPVVSSSFLFLSFPRLISAVADWMSAILPHMMWPL